MWTMFGISSDSENNLRVPPLASARAANGWFHVHGIDAALTQRVLGNSETDLDQLDVLLRVDAVLLQQHREGP